MNRDNRQYDSLDPILQDYYEKYVQMKDQKKKVIVKNLQQELSKTIQKLKDADPLFEKYFNRFGFTGSYWDGARVKLATEFDINLIFKLPNGVTSVRDRNTPPGYTYLKLPQIFSPSPPRIVNRKNLPGGELNGTHDGFDDAICGGSHVDVSATRSYLRQIIETERNPFQRLNLRHNNPFGDGYNVRRNYHRVYRSQSSTPKPPDREISCWTDETFIKPALFLSWMESVFVKANIITRQKTIKNVPALTSTMPFDSRVTVDFVPVFEVHEVYDEINETWFAVPKPPENDQNAWRISTYEREKEMLKNKGYLKFILKLIKKVRDNLNMENLRSYYIKTLFIHEIKENSDLDWSVHTGRLFMHMLDRLEKVLDDRTILSLADKRLNLLSLLSKDTINEMFAQIHNFNNDLKKIIKNSQNKQFQKLIEEKLGEF